MSKYMPAEFGYAMDEAPAEWQGMEYLDFQGVGYDQNALTGVFDEAPVTGGGMNNPWFYLNYLSKRLITVVTQRTTIDRILGRTKEGAWENASVTKQFRELTGHSVPYADYVETTASRVGRGYSYETRDVIRLSAGAIVSELESRQAAMIPGQYSPNQDKREAIALLFQLDRDAIGHFGYNLRGLRCWGLLNDPNLDSEPYRSVATGAAESTKWVDKDAHEIIADLMTAVGRVQKKCRANFTPATDPFKLVIPPSCDVYLGKITECGGYSVRQWIKENWKKCEVVLDPVFEDALGGQNIMYVVLEKLGVSPCAEQIVPASAFLVGAMKREAGHSELWSMATCGTFVEQPLGIARYFGI